MLTPRKAVADSMQIMELDPSVYLAQSAAGRSELLAPSHCFHFRLARSPDAYSIIQPCLPCTIPNAYQLTPMITESPLRMYLLANRYVGDPYGLNALTFGRDLMKRNVVSGS